MMDYSPYEILRRQSYPAIFLSAGLYDPRVRYEEVAKYAAKLRSLKENKMCVNGTGIGIGTPFVFLVGEYGHFGAKSVEGRATTASFLFEVLGIE